jgi:putative spermidine/putrescine transport system ATP-binding protein
MTQGSSVHFENVSKRYGPVTALFPTDLSVASGEFFALLGPSGSGKSTLLGTIAGFVPPSTGRVLIGRSDVTAVPPHRRNVGMVFQNYALFPYLTAGRNIAFPLEMRRLPRSEITERVRRILKTVRLENFEERLPAQLSGGQQQRVALARASVYDPPLLLMDEPLGALDKNLREEMQQEIRQFHQTIGTTILYVTHDQQEAAAMADRIAIMNHGRLVQVGRPRDLYERPANAFVASFLGEANLFHVTGSRDGRVTTREGPTLATAADGGIACIRPENVVITDEPLAHPNSFPGVVTDAVYSAGQVRYRVQLTPECTVTARVTAPRGADPFPRGTSVHVGWSSADLLILPVEGAPP